MRGKYANLGSEARQQIAITMFATIRGKWLLTEALALAIVKLRKESNIADRRITDIEDMELLHEFFMSPKNRRVLLTPNHDPEGAAEGH